MLKSIIISSILITTSCNFSEWKKQPVSSPTSLSINFDNQIKKEIFSDLSEIENELIITPIDTIKSQIKLNPTGTYINKKNSIKNHRNKLLTNYKKAKSDSIKNIIMDSVSRYLENVIINVLIPHWYKTTWAFEGHTSKPGKGEIACGYFISTVLRDAGFNLNRYTLAKQYSSEIVKSLHINKKFKHITNLEVPNFVDSLKLSIKSGLYVVGLDCHVGFLLLRKSKVYLLHSSYIYPSEVIIEHALESPALKGNDNYWIGSITTNNELLKKWLYNEEIKVIKTTN